MKTLSGQQVYVLVPATKEGVLIENVGEDAYKYFDCHSHALGLWNKNGNSGYVFMPASYSVPMPGAFMTTINDPKLFNQIRAPAEAISGAGTLIISGDIITFWDKETGAAVHSVKTDGIPKYSNGILDASTKVFSKNGTEKFDPQSAVHWGSIKEKYDKEGKCTFTVYRHVQNAQPWS